MTTVEDGIVSGWTADTTFPKTAHWWIHYHTPPPSFVNKEALLHQEMEATLIVLFGLSLNERFALNYELYVNWMRAVNLIT